MNAAVVGVLAAVLCSTADAALAARPHVIIFGGGWGPEGTQQSLERQVLALRRALADRQPTVLFADGDPRTRSVQTPGPEDRTTALLGLIFNQRRDLHESYRRSKIADAGPASREGLLTALQDHDQRAGTVLFGVGHGTPAEEERPAALELWGPNDRVTPPELASVLDGGRAGPTAVVLGHCHSGAFTALSRRTGAPGGPVARPARCVFAAVPADREASGCTNDLTAAGAQAYVSRFTEALTQASADLDGDGRTSLAEAHAYARIHDSTIDVPITSAEIWAEEALGARAPRPTQLDLTRLLADAPSAEAAVLTALGASYTRRRDGVAAAERDYRRLQHRLRRSHAELEALQDRFESKRRVVLDRLLARWPELANPYHAVSRALLSGPAPVITKWLQSQPDLEALMRIDRELTASDLEALKIEKTAARLERWLRAAQYVANIAAIRRPLKLGGTPRLAEDLEALLACERLAP